MTGKKWYTISQEITCAQCEKVVERKTNNQKFCSVKCQRITIEEKRKINRRKYEYNCEVCNEPYTTTNFKTKTCSSFCASVFQSITQQLYTDEEIIHLAILNPGYGIRAFAKKVGSSLDRRYNMPFELQRVPYLFEQAKEELKLDLFAHLNNPDYMIEMRIDEWEAKGRPRAGTAHTGQQGPRSNRREYMATYRRYEQSNFKFDRNDIRTHRTVKVFPEFNWGSIEERSYRSNYEEE